MTTDPLGQAKALALRLLAGRARTEAQLRSRLCRAGLADQSDEVVAWLARLGYLDDGAYARARASALLASGRLGPRMVEHRLRAAGVPPALSRAALEAALGAGASASGTSPSPEVALCRAALERRLRGADPASLDDRTRARLARLLLARGFSGQAVARALHLQEDVDG